MQIPTINTSIEFLKGVGPKRAEILRKELQVDSFKDLLYIFPFRYIDRTVITPIREIRPEDSYVQLRGKLTSFKMIGTGNKKRLIANLSDETGSIQLVWFRGANWIRDSLDPGAAYLAYGKINVFNKRINLPHPELEKVIPGHEPKHQTFHPVYSSTETLDKKNLDNRARRKLMSNLLASIKPSDIHEYIPKKVIDAYRLIPLYRALRDIHFPANHRDLNLARMRLKFDELFILQLNVIKKKLSRSDQYKGIVFEEVGEKFKKFYHKNLQFELTDAQKRVLKEIRRDTGSGEQMNRLLQGDVGSGKTVVALMSMLLAIDNGYQACLMAPTEILAQQHYEGIFNYVKGLRLNVALLTGSVKGKQRAQLLKLLEQGDIHILIGTHALLEDPVKFKNLGLAITDEQHRFGVVQRSKLWHKNIEKPPHILVMTATPIPRTLAMTKYGDLDVSVIDELPPGRKPVNTMHFFESGRLQLLGRVKREVDEGRQAYVVYPLIEESEKMDLLNLQTGYEQMCKYFPKPKYQVSVLHGKMKGVQKEFEMQRFVKGKTNIMVSTTVIEVGVNVPNATIMVIENAERFGLSQLHQLRGRVGRGADASYCILMSSDKLSETAKERLAPMMDSNWLRPISRCEDLEI
jgi:ATP-dependent DNA helicase RecG